MTKVEQQQYGERVMQEELDSLKQKLEESQDLARDSIRKLQEGSESLTQLVTETLGEESEILEKVTAFDDNIEIYKEVVRDPISMLEQVERAF